MNLLRDDPLLLVFVVAAVGYLAGRIRIGGFGFGVAAVLFAGLAFGMADPQLKVPRSLWTLGLVLFVYTVGLAAGPGFLGALRRRGVGANVAVLVAVVTAAGAIAATGLARRARRRGHSGRVRGRPHEHARACRVARGAEGDRARGELRRSVGPDPRRLLARLPARGDDRAAGGVRHHATPGVAGATGRRGQRSSSGRRSSSTPASARSASCRRGSGDTVTFGRVKRGELLFVAGDDVEPLPGDLVTVVGPERAVEQVVALLGRESAEHVELDRGDVDFRRIVVSSRAVAGLTIAELDLQDRLGGTVTRVRRGDVDMVAAPGLLLELGDRVRVVAPPERMTEIAAFFGDSYRELRELDVLSFSVGVALGLLVGAIEIPLPGGASFELGFAGGPLIVGLVLGAIGRTGPIVWQLPHSANLTLRQLGTVLFLAGIGVNAGDAFGDTILSRDALGVIAAAVVVAATASRRDRADRRARAPPPGDGR